MELITIGNEVGEMKWSELKKLWQTQAGWDDSKKNDAYKFWRESNDVCGVTDSVDDWGSVNKEHYDHFANMLQRYVDFDEFKELKDGENEEWPILTFTSYKSNSDGTYNDDSTTWRLSIIMYKTTGDHNIDVGVIMYKIPKQSEIDDPTTCSEKTSSSKHACENCENYLETIRDALYAITEDGSDLSGKFKTYNPYIARVIDSWFRDTYFVVPGDFAGDNHGEGAEGNNIANGDTDREEDNAIFDAYTDVGKNTDYGIGTTDYPGNTKLTGNSIDYVEVDEVYLKDTDEYWSRYETTTNSQGETVYVLYELDADGEINTSNKYIKDKDSEGREVYKNIDTGDTEFVEESDLKLVKKAETGNNITDGWNVETVTEDKSGNAVQGKVWTVYKNVTQSGESEKFELDVTSDTDKNVKEIARFKNVNDYKKYFYYTYNDRIVIEQQEDARRGITNPTIKQMFKIREYYIYDGTEEKAQAIYKDWQSVINTYGTECLTRYTTNNEFKEKFNDKYGESSFKEERAVEWALDEYYYNDPHKGPFASIGDPRDKNLIGNITINKDTLNAFSILENTHTLDADYQYRDFKELIVELDYFDKEDLSDKPEEIFEWIIPEYTEKWPLRLIDKSDEYYGTLVHSDLSVTKLKTDLGITDPAADPDADETDPNKTEIANATGYSEGLDVISPVTGQVISYGKYKRDNTDFIQAQGEEETAKTLEGKGRNIEEEVGFIQIKVLDKTSIDLIVDACGSAKISNVEYEDENGDKKTIDIDEYKAWNGFYEEYKDVCEGYVITIEGIELLYGIDSVEDLIANVSSLSAVEMQPKTTPNLVDNSEEIENQKIENAKVLLPAAKVVDGKLYIREGTKIGKTTYSTTTEFKIYSYIRMILRDAKLRLIENVEDYFDLPEGMRLSNAVSVALGSISDTSTKEEKILALMTYFVSEGFTPQGAAGIVGNIFQECRLNPNSDNGDHHGICQWNYSGTYTSPTGGRWKTILSWMTSNGHNHDSFMGQAMAILKSDDANSYTGYINQVKASTSVSNAVDIWCRKYEVCGNYGEEVPKRTIFGEDALKLYKGEITEFPHS